MSKNFLIIGSGFNSLATAYFLKNKNHKVKVIHEKGIKGVLGSVTVENETFDLGYQFFDGLDGETEAFIREMYSNEDLHDFKYGASTFSNNLFYEYHAIPYWKAYGKIFVVKAFIFYLKNFLLTHFTKNNKKETNLSDLYDQLPPNISDIMSKGCEKNYQIKPKELEPSAFGMSTFTAFRQTLFNDKISNFLKKNSRFFDKHLASRRKSISSLEEISLYPKGKNMEYITDKLIARLKSQGVIFEQVDFESINLIPSLAKVEFNDQQFDQVLITTSLCNIKRLFKFDWENDYEHYVSQVFIYFTLKGIDFKYQYVMMNDLNLYCSRISNCSLYSKSTSENNQVLIAEIPLSSKSELWNDEDKLKKIVWNEILNCGILKTKLDYNSAKVLKISKTFMVPKVNFFKFLNEVKRNIDEKFLGNITMMGQGIFTRHLFIKELINKLN